MSTSFEAGTIAVRPNRKDGRAVVDIEMFDLQTGSLIGLLRESGSSRGGYSSGNRDMVLSNNGKLLWARCDSEVRVWDTGTCACIARLELTPEERKENIYLTTTQDGKKLILTHVTNRGYCLTTKIISLTEGNTLALLHSGISPPEISEQLLAQQGRTPVVHWERKVVTRVCASSSGHVLAFGTRATSHLKLDEASGELTQIDIFLVHVIRVKDNDLLYLGWAAVGDFAQVSFILTPDGNRLFLVRTLVSAERRKTFTLSSFSLFDAIPVSLENESLHLQKLAIETTRKLDFESEDVQFNLSLQVCSLDGKRVIAKMTNMHVGDDIGRIYVIDVFSTRDGLITVHPIKHDNVSDACISDNGTLVTSADSGKYYRMGQGRVLVWKIDDLKTLEPSAEENLNADAHLSLATAWLSKDATKALSFGQLDGTVNAWDLANRKRLHSFKPSGLNGNTINTVSADEAFTVAVGGGGSGNAFVLDLRTGLQRGGLGQSAGTIFSIVVSDDGLRALLFAHGKVPKSFASLKSATDSITLWDLDSLALLRSQAFKSYSKPAIHDFENQALIVGAQSEDVRDESTCVAIAFFEKYQDLTLTIVFRTAMNNSASIAADLRLSRCIFAPNLILKYSPGNTMATILSFQGTARDVLATATAQLAYPPVLEGAPESFTSFIASLAVSRPRPRKHVSYPQQRTTFWSRAVIVEVASQYGHRMMEYDVESGEFIGFISTAGAASEDLRAQVLKCGYVESHDESEALFYAVSHKSVYIFRATDGHPSELFDFVALPNEIPGIDLVVSKQDKERGDAPWGRRTMLVQAKAGLWAVESVLP